MTTDNRTSEPTPEQIEAAAQAVREVDARAGLIADVDLPMYRARAALVAAASVAPQAESIPTSKYISPSLSGMIRNLWKSDPSENSVRTALKLAGDLIQELIDLRAANMLREPGVPDAATAAVERVRAVHVRDEYGLCVACSWEYPDASYDAISNDVAWPCPTIAALDGAPEPEWEYAREYRDEAGYPTIRKARDITMPDGHRSDGSPYWNYQVLRRRKAGPWVPVEGESK